MSEIRAISLWEPWATAIACGLKRIETRHWSTDYRGPLAIHAAQRRTEANYIYAPAVASAFEEAGIVSHRSLSFGCIVAVCELRDCVPVEKVRDGIGPVERALGGYEDGRFAWLLGAVRRLETPLPERGRQGFWTITNPLNP